MRWWTVRFMIQPDTSVMTFFLCVVIFKFQIGNKSLELFLFFFHQSRRLHNWRFFRLDVVGNGRLSRSRKKNRAPALNSFCIQKKSSLNDQKRLISFLIVHAMKILLKKKEEKRRIAKLPFFTHGTHCVVWISLTMLMQRNRKKGEKTYLKDVQWFQLKTEI